MITYNAKASDALNINNDQKLPIRADKKLITVALKSKHR